MSSSYSSTNLRVQILRDERSRTRTNSIDPAETDKEEPIDPLTAACRARYERFEKAIAAIFPSRRPCCATDLTVHELLGVEEPSDQDLDGADTSLGLTNGVGGGTPVVKATRAQEDDDYDMDEEDDAPAPTSLPPPPPSVQKPRSPIPPTIHISSPDRTKSPSGAKDSATATREKLEADKKAAEEAARLSFSTMFYTLESDRDAMLDQQKLDESDRQVNAEANAQGAPGKLSNANLGASSLTLKHLIARIDAKRERVAVSDMELRNLMSEVKKNRSKWASEDKVGQEELYEAAEKVVLELRAQTEHSTAFLNRVNKREAPDYFAIIKQPMDLGTVMKKLKQLAYKSKKEFVDDLNLIWQNCLQYNADPKHYLRKHAIAMQKMTQSLIPLIPDITIRDRAEVEAEEAGAHDQDADAESDDEPIMTSRMNRKAPGTSKAKKGAKPARTESTPEAKPPIVNIQGIPDVKARDSPVPAHVMAESSFLSQNGFGTPPPAHTPSNGYISQLDLESTLEKYEVEDDLDLEYKTWKTMTKKSRARAASERHKLFRAGKIQLDEPALIRGRVGLGRFIRSELAHGDKEAAKDIKAPLAVAVEEQHDEEDEMLPNYYKVLDSVPELPWNLAWLGDDDEEIDKYNDTLRMAPKGIFTQPPAGLARSMDSNMKTMQETRKICHKIGVIKQMQVQTQVYSNQFAKYDPQEFVEKEPEDFLISDDGPIMSGEVSKAAFQRSVAKLFYHAGFEDFQPTAFDLVTDIAASFFKKIGKTVMLYQETVLPTGKFAPDEILLHTLGENGLEIEALESYIRDDVERLGIKLVQLKERMRAHLDDLLRPTLVDAENPEAAEEDMRHFINGDFTDDVGDDYYGFKEIGLEREFGMSISSGLMRVLQGRLANSYQTQSSINAAVPTTEYKAPPPFEPLSRDLLKDQIGLVQNFFLAKLHANSEEPLIEDEDLPIKQRAPKPRLPPTGKITTPRKRPVSGQGGNSKKKKRPNPPPPVATKPPPGGSTAIIAPTATPPLSEENNGLAPKFEEKEMDNTPGMMSPESILAV
ncbi:Transcriptional activator spt7 [Orbilia ellipsospora]|uniref:SAGA complex subunit Spt7 n=1 Tax=Orbilia ellipsospora TaxID=2528407 RepID=A0AAV9X2E4_9PEZI